MSALTFQLPNGKQDWTKSSKNEFLDLRIHKFLEN